MITPNGGVFGRNPKFNNVTVEGDLNVSGGMTSTPNDVAPTSNVTIGSSAGANLVAGSVGNICIGSGAGDVLGASGRNVAIGTDALGAFSAGAASIINTTAGTASTNGTQTGVLLEKASGDGEMAVYPTVTLVVTGGAVGATITITSPGSGATVASGLVFKTSDARIDANWRGTLDSVTGDNVAIGHNALLLNSASATQGSSVAIGSRALDALTTGGGSVGIGANALGSLTTGNTNVAVGINALASQTTNAGCVVVGANSGGGNSVGMVAVGETVFANVSGTNGNGSIGIGLGAGVSAGNSASAAGCVLIGERAMLSANGVAGTVAVGQNAGRFRGPTGTTATGTATNSVFIGVNARANGDSQTNQVVIGGPDSCGDGSNTTVLNNSSTTSTRIAGTATSVLCVDGDTVRVVNDRTIANAGDAGNEGDICWDANYLYVCVAANTWKRVAIATWP